MAKAGRIPKNRRAGQWIATVETLGYVPPCVRDAFSWLPHPWGYLGRGKDRKVGWYYEMYEGEMLPPAPQPAAGQRCYNCIFQEPPWSQGYAWCSHSYLHDRDGDCQAFVDRRHFLDVQPSYTEFCRPPRPEHPGLIEAVYWRDGTRYKEFTPTCNLPSHYCARLNMPHWYYNGAEGLYSAVERERLRRFWQWAKDATVEQTGAFQYNMFLQDLEGVA